MTFINIFSAEIRVRSILFGGKQSNLQIINWQDLFKILRVIVQIFCKINLSGDKLIPVHSGESYIELDFSFNVLADELYRNQLSSWFGCLLSKELLIL